ncbi:FimB/Mfa2 family fimbrial subunit [Parabacteroides pacaensis]|uniref:FimB/Mfa2 family fimbrial subunit n=1 Tax=Parabacteroides pacaensis TaxID=2086575 RepID=UPI000D0FEADD|nr:FimB/Mfa2 family fimbrial subunit [Parabacteroides pacaensis]
MIRFNYIIKLALLVPGVMACTEKEDLPAANQPAAEVTFVYPSTKAGEGSPVVPHIYIFRENGDGFFYEKSIQEGWSVGSAGKYHLSTQLDVGNYKFFFAASYGTNTLLMPEPLTGTTTPEDLSFQNGKRPDGTILPADELFLPVSLQEATKSYAITSPRTISCTLNRSVAQLVVKLKRQVLKNGEPVEESYPYPTDHILNYLQQITVELTGVGEGLNFSGNYGTGATITQLDLSKAEFDNSGFATLHGPFFFPTEGKDRLEQLTITLQPTEGSRLLENTASVTWTEGLPVKTNWQLIATVFITEITEKVMDIKIEITTGPITEEVPGDEGMWDDNMQKGN